jgi:hypothetical protein
MQHDNMGIAIEHWSANREAKVINWLRTISSQDNKWSIDYDYNLVTLVLSKELYLMYKLTWG